MTKPQVTFILPVYNAEEYLTACLDSIINQTVRELEIICVDDCSTDNSLSILTEHARQDPRIVIIHFEKNRGPGAARNAGLDAAHGEFVRMVDPDDFIPKDSTRNLLNAARQFNSDFVRGAVWNCDAAGKKVNKHTLSSRERIECARMDYRMTNYFGQHWTFLYRLTALRSSGARYDENMRNGQDTAFMIDLAPYMKKTSLIPETVYYYRMNSESTMQRKRDKQFYHNIFSLYRRAHKRLSLCGLEEVADSYLHGSCCEYFPNNIVASIPHHLTADEAEEVLEDLQSLFSELNGKMICFTHEYTWQKERSVPHDMKCLILLLENGMLYEAYETLQQYNNQKKNQEHLKQQLTVAQKKIEDLHSSTSWRLTAPLRFLRSTKQK